MVRHYFMRFSSQRQKFERRRIPNFTDLYGKHDNVHSAGCGRMKDQNAWCVSEGESFSKRTGNWK